MIKKTYKIRVTVWLYPGVAGWHFVTLPKKQAHEIRKNFGVRKRGWGSIPITATIHNTSWNTSIFPDKKTDSYLLPLKAQVRKKEKIYANQTITLTITLKQ